MANLIIKNATLPNGSVTDIAIAGELITAVGTKLPGTDATVIDAKGLVVLPGFVDLHTHLRE
ncbi:MAG: Dihydroorotase, partial [Actinomycetota bacterium]